MIQIPEHIPTWWYVVAGAVVALALLVWAYLLLRAYRTRRTIDAAISNVAYEMLKNVLIPNGNGGQIQDWAFKYGLGRKPGIDVPDVEVARGLPQIANQPRHEPGTVLPLQRDFLVVNND